MGLQGLRTQGDTGGCEHQRAAARSHPAALPTHRSPAHTFQRALTHTASHHESTTESAIIRRR